MITKQTLSPAQFHNDTPQEVIVKVRPDIERKLLSASSKRSAFSIKSALETVYKSDKAISIRPLFEGGEAVGRRSFDNGRRFSATNLNDQGELSDLNVITYRNNEDAAEAVAELSKDPMVEYAHVPAPRYFAFTDPNQNRQWGLRAIDYFTAIGHPGYNNAKKVRIAILDSGIDPGHADLSNIFSINQNFSTLGGNDDSGHGTHVAGIISAITNNGIGISGTCESDQLIILRGLTNPYSGTAYYAALRAAISHGAQVLNCSLGGGYDPTEALIIRTAISNGMIVVAAMGNDYQKGNPTSYPAALPDVIAVGAFNEANRRASFSQVGSHIWITAPGTSILSTVPTYPVSLTTELEYDSWDGTSMATPFVTAAVALMLAKNPSASLADVKSALAKSAFKTPGSPAFTQQMGYGRLNLAGALDLI